MPNDQGRWIRLSKARRMVGYWLQMSQGLPLAHGERRADLRVLREAIARARPKPQWLSIFFKAYAIVAAKRPALRRHYVKYPWPRIYEHPVNVGSIVVSRKLDGEDALFYLLLKQPEELPLAEIDRRLMEARHLPFDQIPSFRRQLRHSDYPWPIRPLMFRVGLNCLGRGRSKYIGTFGCSVLASMGLANLTTLVPWTTMIHYTPFADDGSVMLRIAIDHRVLDGLEAAYALLEMEQALNGVIADEIRALGRSQAA